MELKVILCFRHTTPKRFHRLANRNTLDRWTIYLTGKHNKSLDASGGSVFRKIIGAAKVE